MKTSLLLALALLLPAAGAARATVNIEWVTVGDAGNAADSTGFGAVAYAYQIGKYEVTNAQYCEFLNAVDYQVVQDYALYDNNMGLDSTRGGIAIVIANPPGSRFVVRPNMADKPVNHVNWLSAARFANWLQNGQGNASTETGTYELNGSMSYAAFPRAAGGIGLPTHHEWYKAAYYRGGTYTLHATGSNTSSPVIASCDGTGVITNPGINVVNYAYGCDWNSQNGHVTTVGSAGAASYYGTYDQAGNVAEFTDTATNSTGLYRILRGGGFDASQFQIRSTTYFTYTTHTVGAYNIGFRLARAAPPPVTVSNVDTAHSHWWSGSAGWISLVHNRPDTGSGVRVNDTRLSGYVWNGSVGWIHLGDDTPSNGLTYSNSDSSDYGVNLDISGNLGGLGWSGSTGWINFGWAAPEDIHRPRIDLMTGHFSGYAWSGSLGWITLGTGRSKVKNLHRPDTDADQIADAWEKQRTGGLSMLSATADSDGDGLTDYQEYLADTDPLSANSRPRMNEPVIFLDEENPGVLFTLLSWPGSTGRLFRIEMSPDLVNWQDSGLGLLYPGESGQNFNSLMHTGIGSRFYRVLAQLPLEP